MIAQTEDALRLAKWGGKPVYEPSEYEDALEEIAKAEATGRETPADCLKRLLDARDPRVMALYKAARPKPAAVIPGSPDDERVRERLLDERVRLRKRPGESMEQALARLLREDDEVRDAYRTSRRR